MFETTNQMSIFTSYANIFLPPFWSCIHISRFPSMRGSPNHPSHQTMKPMVLGIIHFKKNIHFEDTTYLKIHEKQSLCLVDSVPMSIAWFSFYTLQLHRLHPMACWDQRCTETLEILGTSVDPEGQDGDGRWLDGGSKKTMDGIFSG